MVVIVPINEYEKKTHDVAYKNGNDRSNIRPSIAMRHFYFQNHDGNDDGDDAITESFKSIFRHVFINLIDYFDLKIRISPYFYHKIIDENKSKSSPTAN